MPLLAALWRYPAVRDPLSRTLPAVGLTVVIYLVGYILFFLGYFKLIFKGKDHERAFNVFGGTVGKCIVAGIGLLLTVFALIRFVLPAKPA